MKRLLSLIAALSMVACGTPTEPSHTIDQSLPQDGFLDASTIPEFVDVPGLVVDSATGRGIEAARICLTDASAPCARTDTNGAFTIPGHAVGARLTLLVYADGYEQALRPLTVHANGPQVELPMLGVGTLDRVAAMAESERDAGLTTLLITARTWTPEGIEPLTGVRLVPDPRMGGDAWYGARTAGATGEDGRAWMLNAVQGVWSLGLATEGGQPLLCATAMGWIDGGAQQVPLMPGYVTQVDWTCLQLPERFVPDPIAGPATPERPGVDPAVGFPRADEDAEVPVLCPVYDAARYPTAGYAPDWGILCPTFEAIDLTSPTVAEHQEFPVLCPVAVDPQQRQPRAEDAIEYVLLCPLRG